MCSDVGSPKRWLLPTTAGDSPTKKGRKVTVFFFQWVTQWYSLLQTHCYRMFVHTAHRAVYYLTEEGIPWLVSIRARYKSHVPLLLTARVRQSIGPWGWHGITTEVRRAYVQPLPNTQHTTPPTTSYILQFFPGSLSEPAVKLKIWMSVSLIPTTSYLVAGKTDASANV